MSVAPYVRFKFCPVGVLPLSSRWGREPKQALPTAWDDLRFYLSFRTAAIFGRNRDFFAPGYFVLPRNETACPVVQGLNMSNMGQTDVRPRVRPNVGHG